MSDRNYFNIDRHADSTDAVAIIVYLLYLLIAIVSDNYSTPALVFLAVATIPAKARVYRPLFYRGGPS